MSLQLDVKVIGGTVEAVCEDAVRLARLLHVCVAFDCGEVRFCVYRANTVQQLVEAYAAAKPGTCIILQGPPQQEVSISAGKTKPQVAYEAFQTYITQHGWPQAIISCTQPWLDAAAELREAWSAAVAAVGGNQPSAQVLTFDLDETGNAIVITSDRRQYVSQDHVNWTRR